MPPASTIASKTPEADAPNQPANLGARRAAATLLETANPGIINPAIEPNPDATASEKFGSGG